MGSLEYLIVINYLNTVRTQQNKNFVAFKVLLCYNISKQPVSGVITG